ncbi:MAG TPA: DUF402 domain-containing protein [Anaerolineaceae bacterium]|nr:DUF402 domain-containing protein [Anaerolineaceae bacterium]
MSANVHIHLERIGKKTTVYSEGYVDDDGVRLKTCSVLPPQTSELFSQIWWRADLVTPGRLVGSVCKYLFYGEWFDVVELRGAAGELIGYYCDICTPVVRQGQDYFLTDLFLDLWIEPDGSMRELDWDEFEEAAAGGLISVEWQQAAVDALERLKTLAASGRLQMEYLRD